MRHNGVVEKGDMYKMQKRKALKMFRLEKELSQQEMADMLGLNRSTYAMVERGQRRGSDEMWATLKNTFNVPDADMWKLMQKGD